MARKWHRPQSVRDSFGSRGLTSELGLATGLEGYIRRYLEVALRLPLSRRVNPSCERCQVCDARCSFMRGVPSNL